MNLPGLNFQAQDLKLKDLQVKSGQASTQEVKTFEQGMNVKDLRNITVQRETPKEVTVAQIQQINTPGFKIPSLNNNTVNFDFQSQSSQDIQQQN